MVNNLLLPPCVIFLLLSQKLLFLRLMKSCASGEWASMSSGYTDSKQIRRLYAVLFFSPTVYCSGTALLIRDGTEMQSLNFSLDFKPQESETPLMKGFVSDPCTVVIQL